MGMKFAWHCLFLRSETIELNRPISFTEGTRKNKPAVLIEIHRYAD